MEEAGILENPDSITRLLPVLEPGRYFLSEERDMGSGPSPESDPWDLEWLRLPAKLVGNVSARKRPPQHRSGEPFIGGRFPTRGWRRPVASPGPVSTSRWPVGSSVADTDGPIVGAWMRSPVDWASPSARPDAASTR